MKVVVARVPRPNVVQPMELPEGATVEALLRQLGAPVDAVVVLRDGVPVPLDAPMADGDSLRVVNVFSGG